MSETRLRRASGADHGLYLRFFAQLGTQDPPLSAERWQRECAPSTAFLMNGSREIGYAAWELAAPNAHVRHVVVDAAERGRGLGRRLMDELAAHLRAQGARAWRLNVFSNNATALGLYRRLGLDAIYSTAVLRLDWEHAAHLGRPPAHSQEVASALDAAHESDFGLMEGQLGRARERQGVRILSAHAANGKCMAIAVFDPGFPGAFPFRCKSPEYARTLIDAMRSVYDGPETWVQLVIEDAAVVVEHLRAAGARQVNEIVHMRGAIPRGDRA